jgi:steroid delta-isomerase-like uncharacterized protein
MGALHPFSCINNHSEKTMSINKNLVSRYFEAIWNQGQFEQLDELVDPAYRGQTRAAGQRAAEGHEGLRTWVGGVRKLFPDGKRTVDALIAEGDRVVALVTSRGTHAASGRTVVNEVTHVFEVRQGRIAGESVYFDVGGTLKQLSA